MFSRVCAVPGRRGFATLLFVVATSTVATLVPSRAVAQEVSYSVLPSWEEVRWNDAFGLERARLLGVRASLDFGPFFSLQPFYAWNDEVGIRDGLVVPDGSGVSELFDVKAFGADMQVNIGHGSLVPFVRGGGGVFRTDDEEEGRRDRIFLRAGGGLRIGFGRSAGVELAAERWATRLSSPLIPGAVSEEDFPDDGIVNSTVYGIGLRLPLGGGTRATEGVRGILPGVYVEPYAARIDFADELRLERQYLAGARAGVDLNRNVGLRGYVWRGVEDDFSEWMELEGYGAEAQFALNVGSGLSPFLVAGAGRIEFKDGYLDLDGAPRTRENHLILGGGATFGLSDHVRVELGARNFLMSVGTELEDITSPDELVSNWKYSAGVSVSFGAQGRTAAQRSEDRARDRYQDDLDRLAEENRRLREGLALRAEERAAVRPDTLTAGRTMTIPVPEVGEVILRYGGEYAVRAPLTAEGVLLAGDTTAARLQRELLEARLPGMIRGIIREELARTPVQPGAPVPVVVEAAPTESFLQDGRLHALIPFAGVQPSSPVQVVLGIRSDLGRVSGPIPLTILPELSLGVGEGRTTARAALMGRLGWDVGMGRNLTAYGQGGVSLTTRRFLSLDLGYGVTFDAFQSSARGPFNLFVEHRGVALYKEHQLLLGVSLPR